MKNCFFYNSHFIALFLILFPLSAFSTPVNFAGQLDVIEINNGTGIYSATPLGTDFSGFIDDVNFNGEISDGTTLTSFSCCIAAGGLEISNDVVLNADNVATLNALTGTTTFNVGDIVDLIDIEGDEMTRGGGRIEIGLSYLFDSTTFSDDNLDNYPFDPNDLQLAAFFILEEDEFGADVYSALGQLNAVPLPASAWLFSTGIVFLISLMKRKHSLISDKE